MIFFPFAIINEREKKKAETINIMYANVQMGCRQTKEKKILEKSSSINPKYIFYNTQ